MKQIEILTTVITSAHGTLSTGDRLSVSPEYAKHLVEECKAAKYVEGKGGDDAGASNPAKAKPAHPEKPASKKEDA